MMQVLFSFVDESATDPIGFELGDMEFRGKFGTVTSQQKTPSQSVMLILSLIGLLDGLRQLLSTPKANEFRFVGVDSSFAILFRKSKDGQIGIYGENLLLDSVLAKQLKKIIEESVLEFAKFNNLGERMNAAEANDFRASLATFQAFLC
jgi:hypothetical protein